MFKKTLAASAVLTIALSATTFGATPQLINNTINHWYVNGFGGAGFVSNIRGENEGITQKEEFKTGYDLGLGVGYRFESNFRLEAALSYLDSNINKVSDSNGSDSGSGDIKAYDAMLNGYYDFTQLSKTWVPYVGVGAGYLNLNNDVKFSDEGTIRKIEAKDNLFAYQAIVGLGYHFNPNMAVSVDYRYLATCNGDVKVKNPDGTSETTQDKYKNNLVNLGLTYYFA